jgi:hypothetical protein
VSALARWIARLSATTAWRRGRCILGASRLLEHDTYGSCESRLSHSLFGDVVAILTSAATARVPRTCCSSTSATRLVRVRAKAAFIHTSLADLDLVLKYSALAIRFSHLM